MGLNALNPFQLHGPAFLAFYLALMGVTLLALRQVLRSAEATPALPPPQFDDPYLIAYLRDGAEEAIRVATVSLTDRGLLELDGKQLNLRSRQVLGHARRDIEKAVLEAYRSGGDGDTALKHAGARRAADGYRELLQRHGLLADASVYARRATPVAVAAAVLPGTAIVRITEALAHGRTNVVFLAVLGLVSAVAIVVNWRRRRTAAGDAALADLRVLFSRLKARAATLKPGGASNEMALLIGVFGLAALSSSTYAFVEQIYPKPQSDSSSSGGSSDSSSCGSSCGGGCGGGGCGGE